MLVIVRVFGPLYSINLWGGKWTENLMASEDVFFLKVN